VVAWLTGLPSSGKSTLARRVADRCRAAGLPCAVLDGDDLRAALVPAPGYDGEARERFHETLARLAALLAAQGLVVIVAATAHRRAWRERARRLAPRFVEVHLATPLDACEARDAKGLYARARAGGATALPGAGAAYEVPLLPDVVASGGEDDAAAARVTALCASG
jgi:adenylylsulfate kinase